MLTSLILRQTYLLPISIALLSAPVIIAEPLFFRTFADKADFLSSTTAASATGPLPRIGIVRRNEIVTLGFVRVSTPNRELFIGSTGNPTILDWTPVLPGNDLAISETEDLDVLLSTAVFSFGFDFQEPTTPFSISGGCFDIVCFDSLFEVTLLMDGTQLVSFLFNAPDEVAAFVGVQSNTLFNGIEIREISGGIDDEFFGEFYTGDQALQSVAEPQSGLLVVSAVLAWIGYRRLIPQSRRK